jgi:hypothetical protein
MALRATGSAQWNLHIFFAIRYVVEGGHGCILQESRTGGAMVGFSCRVDPRLERRYWKLVAEHSTALKASAAGLRALPGTGKAFASTQAMWRFLQNDRLPRTTLVQPLCNYARECLEEGVTVHGSLLTYQGVGVESRLSLRESRATFAERKTTMAARERLRRRNGPRSCWSFTTGAAAFSQT